MAELFSGWPHFISTAPGVAYAYVDDYRRNRKDISLAVSEDIERSRQGRLELPCIAEARCASVLGELGVVQRFDNRAENPNGFLHLASSRRAFLYRRIPSRAMLICASNSGS